MITALTPEVLDDKRKEQAGLPHVLLVLDQFPKALGGGERVLLKVASLLPQYGYRPSILTFSANPESEGIKRAPCPIYLLPLRRTYDFTAMRAALELGRFLEEQRVQIVQTFFESSDLWAGSVTKMMSDAKLIWSRRDMGILRGQKHRLAYRLLAGVPNHVFAVSDQIRQYCIEVDRINPVRVSTVYNGLDVARWNGSVNSKITKPADKIVIATVGNIRRVKGHDVFVKAAATIAAQFPKATFSIAGDVLEPDYFAELEVLVRSLNLSGRFRFEGGIADVQEYLSNADIFVLPSRSEGFSNAIIEAMAASLPVVVTDVGGNAEAVTDGVNGYVIPADDASALSAGIARLLLDPAKAAEMGAAGKEKVGERFTNEAMMRQTTAVYASLLAQG